MFFNRRARQKRELEEAELDAYLSKVKFFPGDDRNCGRYLGFPVDYLRLKTQDSRVTYARRNNRRFVCISPIEVKRELVKNKVVALTHVDNALAIDSKRGYVFERKYGVPVVRAEQ